MRRPWIPWGASQAERERPELWPTRLRPWRRRLIGVGPAKIVAVKVSSPLGEYPLVFRRLERRDGEVAIVGTIAGIESSLLLGRDDIYAAVRSSAAPLAIAALLIAWRWRRRA